jgi:HK97 family phage major capsid protein
LSNFFDPNNFTKDIKQLAKDTDTSVAEVMTAFEEFKKTNDAAIVELKGRGADPVTTDKLAKIEQTLVSHETKNQELTLAAQVAKNQELEIKALKEAMAKLEAKGGRPGAGASDIETKAAKALEYKAAFDSYCRKTVQGITPEEYKVLNEYKVLQANTDTLGGYYLSPAEMAADIIKNVVLMSPIRSLGRVTTIGGPSLKLPKRTGTFAAKRVGELDTRTETTGYTTGMVEIFAPEMYAEVHISEQMIEDSMFDIEAEMMKEFSEQFAVKEGAEFVVGTGTNNQAEGFMTSTQVTNTFFSGSATTLAGASGVQADGLINMFYGLKTAYAKNATWTLNRQSLGSVRKLKDLYGGYIWSPGIAGSLPSAILSAPYIEVPDMPNEGAGLYPIAVGDFQSGYRIVDRVLISVLRDPFTIANAGQILFRARKRVGGAVVKGEAIAKMRCATS